MFALTLLCVACVACVTCVASCPARCSCGGVDLMEFTCDSRIYKVMDEGYAEADCQGLSLDCALIPPLPTPAPLRRLELTNCSLPPGAAACFVRALNSPPPEEIMTTGLVGPLEEGAFEGLEGVQVVTMMRAGSQTSLPPLSPLTPSTLRVVEGTNLTLPSSPLPPSLRYVEVSLSGVRSLTPAAFQGLNDLETLSVWGNDIEELDEDLFPSLPSLRTLSLSRNPLKRVRVSRAVKLVSLVANRVDVDILEEGDVSGIASLAELTLQSNSPLSLSPRSLSSLPALSSLSLTYSKISSLPISLFEGSYSLVNVTFKGNNIQNIHEDLFKNQTSLRRLDLSENSLHSITREMFHDMISLHDLKLDHNKLSSLPDRIFSSCPNLTSLSISYNLISSISPQAFQSSTLKRLVLSHNLLPYSPPTMEWGREYYDIGEQSPFNTLLQLEELDLSYNNISYMFSDWRYILIHRLKLLDLSHNAFTEINSGDLQFLQTDLTVNLSYNNITSVMPPPPYLDPPTIHSPTIILDHNPYNCDCNLYPLLNNLPELPNYRVGNAQCDQPLQLRHTTLTTLNIDILTCPLPDSPQCIIRPHKNRLECTENQIKTLPNPAECCGLPDLTLKLTENINIMGLPEYVTELNMSSLGIKNIKYIPKTVKIIDLSDNNLNNVPLEVLEGNHSFYLKGNPILCDCWNSDSIVNIQKYKSKILDFMFVECESGGGVGVVDASALCDVHRAAAIGSILAILGIMLAIVLTLSWRYSVEIRLYLSSLPGLEFLLDEEKFDENKKYDIFVSFSHEDFPWVRDTLMPILDKEYKVCVHYREWEVGQPIPVQIQRSVEQSRRTVVVLSSSFIKSMWAVEEFRAACAQSARDNTTRAVVIMLEKVDLTTLHEDLRNYLSLTTYLEAQDNKFWEKLKRALPRHPKKLPTEPDTTPLPRTDTKRPSLITAIKNKFKRQTIIDLPEPIKIISDGKTLDVVLDQNGQLVNRAYVKDV